MSVEKKHKTFSLDDFRHFELNVPLNTLIQEYPFIFDCHESTDNRRLLLLQKIQRDYRQNRQENPVIFWAQIITFFHHEMAALSKSKKHAHRFDQLNQLLNKINDKEILKRICYFATDKNYQFIRPQIEKSYSRFYSEYYRNSDVFLNIKKIISKTKHNWFKTKNTRDNEKNLTSIKKSHKASLTPSDPQEISSVPRSTAEPQSLPNQNLAEAIPSQNNTDFVAHTSNQHQLHLIKLYRVLANTSDKEDQQEIKALITTVSGLLTRDQKPFLDTYPILVPILQKFYHLQTGWLASTRKIAKNIYPKLKRALKQKHSAGECLLIFTKELFLNYYEYNRFVKNDVEAMLLQLISFIKRKPGFFEFKHLADLSTCIPLKHRPFQQWLLEKLYTYADISCSTEDKLYFFERLHELEERTQTPNSRLTDELQHLNNCSHLLSENQSEALSVLVVKRNTFFAKVPNHKIVKKPTSEETAIEHIDPDNPHALVKTGVNEKGALSSVETKLNMSVTDDIHRLLSQKGIITKDQFDLNNPDVEQQILQKYASVFNQDDENTIRQMLSEYKLKQTFIQARKAITSQPKLQFFYNLFVVTYVSKKQTSTLTEYGELALKETSLNKKIGFIGTILTSAVPFIPGIFGGAAKAAQAIEKTYQEKKHALFADIMLYGSGLEYFTQILGLKIVQLASEKILESKKAALKIAVHEMTEHILHMFATGLVSVEALIEKQDPQHLWTDEELYVHLASDIIQKINLPLPQTVFSAVASASIENSQNSVKSLVTGSSTEGIKLALGSSQSAENPLIQNRNSSMLKGTLRNKSLEFNGEFNQKRLLLTLDEHAQDIQKIKSYIGFQSSDSSFRPSQYDKVQIPEAAIHYKMTPQQVKDIFMNSYLDTKKTNPLKEKAFFETQNSNRSSQEMVHTEISITASYLQFFIQQLKGPQKANSERLSLWSHTKGRYEEQSYGEAEILAYIEDYRMKLLWDCRSHYQASTMPREIQDILDFAVKQSPAIQHEPSNANNFG